MAFPDLQPDAELFPPPLISSYLEIRQRVLRLGRDFSPAAHFPGYRFFLVNGKSYVITPEL